MRLIAGFDLETTGLLEPEHRIVELALVLADLDTGKRMGSFVKRWNPGRPIDPKAQEVHGISFDDVANLPLLEHDPQSIAMIQKILTRVEFVVAHNGLGFDKPFIEQEFARIGKHLPDFGLVDTMVEGRWATPYGKSPNLGELCFACRVPYDPSQAHAAEYDVNVMLDAFFHGWGKGFFRHPRPHTVNASQPLREAA